jgi:hypothetical protein
LEIYVAFFLVAACVSVLVRQILDRIDARTDRDKLVYQGVSLGIKVNKEGGQEGVAATVTFRNVSSKPMDILLDELSIRVGDRVEPDHTRRTSRLKIGPQGEGWFKTWPVDITNMSGNTIAIKLSGKIKYGHKANFRNELPIELVGQAVKVGGNYEFGLWSPDPE